MRHCTRRRQCWHLMAGLNVVALAGHFLFCRLWRNKPGGGQTIFVPRAQSPEPAGGHCHRYEYPSPIAHRPPRVLVRPNRCVPATNRWRGHRQAKQVHRCQFGMVSCPSVIDLFIHKFTLVHARHSIVHQPEKYFSLETPPLKQAHMY